MSLRRNISLSSGLSYQGGWPYAAYILHRIGGSALFIFFTLYILSLLGFGFANILFGNWFVQIILLILGLFHAINGLRITILDLFPALYSFYERVVNVEWVAYVLLALYAVFVILSSAFGG
jgi:succinate dehydrogenase / fumarate reductase, cytochrome b subunit